MSCKNIKSSSSIFAYYSLSFISFKIIKDRWNRIVNPTLQRIKFEIENNTSIEEESVLLFQALASAIISNSNLFMKR